ncbi:MAG: hypothetical protein K2Q22_06570, partial [Cytophagales bacterium]|nr:hypothetical protein [Cytophagales bacterium]
VNLGLGVSGILGETKNMKRIYNTYETITELNNMQKVYLFNGGLDFAYIATGFCLREWSQNNSQYQNVLLGFGNSLILQGGFLMAFDFAMVALHSSQNPKLKELFTYIRPTPTGVAFCYNF